MQQGKGPTNSQELKHTQKSQRPALINQPIEALAVRVGQEMLLSLSAQTNGKKKKKSAESRGPGVRGQGDLTFLWAFGC